MHFLSMCVHVCACAYGCTHMWETVSVYVCACMYACVHLFAYVCVHTCACRKTKVQGTISASWNVQLSEAVH